MDAARSSAGASGTARGKAATLPDPLAALAMTASLLTTDEAVARQTCLDHGSLAVSCLVTALDLQLSGALLQSGHNRAEESNEVLSSAAGRSGVLLGRLCEWLT